MSLRVVALLVLLSSVAAAEERALTVEVGGGGTAALLPAPSAMPATANLGTAALVRGGVRYGLLHWLDLGLGGFWEPGVRYLHRGVDLYVPGDSSEMELRDGIVQHELTRFGAVASARFTLGLQLRVFGQVDLGWSRRLYSGFRAYNTTSRPDGYAVEQSTSLSDFAADNLLAAVGIGFEYQVTDALAIAVAPRFEALLGRESAFAVTLPLLLSWSWLQ